MIVDVWGLMIMHVVNFDLLKPNVINKMDDSTLDPKPLSKLHVLSLLGKIYSSSLHNILSMCEVYISALNGHIQPN